MAVVVKRFRVWVAGRRRAKALTTIREIFAWFGYSLDDFTDEEIEAGHVALVELVRSSQLTPAEAADALYQVATAGFTPEQAPGDQAS